ncbi:MFS transporter [Nocardioides sp. TF02-7]|nr:MFS transporter [Nocardioides sp. TF02-7]UMG94934.1 MFS transporter [Nocardioides sp. TF02-7]
MVWGPLGDRLGRKSVLALTILLMSAATLGVGLIPSYDSIGMLAPALLVFLRMVQGFSTGGEYGGAATFMAEYAPDQRRGFLGSFLEVGTLAGYACGALLMLTFSLVLGDDAMHDWGWRVPFLVAAPLGIVGLYLRSRMSDTPVFEEASATGSTEDETGQQFHDLVAGYWKQILLLGGLVLALNVCNYTLLTYMPTYLDQRLGLTTNEALLVPVIGMLSMMVFLPFAGHLSDRVGRKPLWWTSLTGLFVMAVPMFLLMATGLPGAIVGFAVLGLLFTPQLATISATFPAMFPTQVRFAGFAIAYNVSTSLFGGTAPAANDWLVDRTGLDVVPALSMMVACLAGAVAMRHVVETSGSSLRGTELPGTEASERELAELDAR